MSQLVARMRGVVPGGWVVAAAWALVAALVLGVLWRARADERPAQLSEAQPATAAAAPTRTPVPTATSTASAAPPATAPAVRPLGSLGAAARASPSGTPVGGAAPTAASPPATPAPGLPTRPAFAATDRIGAPMPVNLRAGPGTDHPALGALPPDTPLAATGEAARVGGVLWRRFRTADGRDGWVRDLDTLPLR